jgi:hypothetical protein
MMLTVSSYHHRSNQGSFWSAWYFCIQKLIPPNEYADQKQTWIDQNLTILLERRLLHFGVFSAEDEGTLAAGRYANEQWLALICMSFLVMFR